MTVFIICISAILLVGYAALLLYFRYCWSQIPDATVSVKGNYQTKISIIIPARNEANNIGACLDSIFSQTYPTNLYEVIVIDDHSTDGTAKIVSGYAGKNVRLLTLKDYLTDTINAYKKKAIEIAIGEATGDLIITTDADCIAPAKWLETIVTFYQSQPTAFIAMPVKFSVNNSFLEIFQSLDFMSLQGITGAAVTNKMMSMCNGANLAYSKKAFHAVGGFKGIDQIASGDDMLLMHKIFKSFPKELFFLKSPDVIVQTQPMHTMNGFLNQRIRWASKADRYDDKRIFAVLLMVYCLNAWIVFLGIASLVNLFIAAASVTPFYSVIALLIAKTMVELIFLFPVAGFFSEKKLLWWFPISQPFHVLYTVVAGWLGKFGSYQWKGRTVN